MQFIKGYHCRVTSWENDADHYKTESVVLQDIESVNQLNKFLSEIMISGSNDNLPKPYQGNCYGNGRNADHEQFYEIMKDYLTTDEISDWTSDCIYDLIGYSEDIGGWRVFESMEVFYVPEDIAFETIELEKF
jgi:hypothetical protein